MKNTDVVIEDTFNRDYEKHMTAGTGNTLDSARGSVESTSVVDTGEVYVKASLNELHKRNMT